MPDQDAVQPAPDDLPPIDQDPVAIALGFVDPPEQMSDELRARVERLKRHGQAVLDQDAALRQRYGSALAERFPMATHPSLGELVQAVLAVRDEEIAALRQQVEQLKALTATCTCPDSCETYAGPEADCPVHGSVRALNEAMAAIDRHRDRASTLTAWAHAELGQRTDVLHYVLSVINNLSDSLELDSTLRAALDEPEAHHG